MLFLLLVILLKGWKLSFPSIRKNLPVLLASGTCLGFNWILLFEAYQYTSVATATLCYYMAPVIVIFVSAAVLKERLTGKKLLCCGAALLGMVLVSGVFEAGFAGMAEMKGILLGLSAAVFYAGVILFNKKLKGINAYDKTITQLAVSSVVLLPYTIVMEDWGAVVFTPVILGMLLVVGILHTGVAYALYFGSMGGLKAQTIALYSYLDPVLAILLSALFLQEKMSAAGIAGAVLILGATMLSEKEA